MNIETFGFGNQFTLESAFELLNCHVVKKGDEEKANSTIEVIGFVAGIITLNDEVEVMVLEIDEERRRISLGMKQCKA